MKRRNGLADDGSPTALPTDKTYANPLTAAAILDNVFGEYTAGQWARRLRKLVCSNLDGIENTPGDRAADGP